MSTTTKPPVLLVSGGLDSFVAYYYLNKPRTVHFDTGGRYSRKEARVVCEQFPEVVFDCCLNMKVMEQENAHIPFRNLYFAMTAVAKYSDTVYIAGVKDDAMTDKSPEAFTRFSELLSDLEKRPIQVLSPFWHMTKAEVLRWYLEAGHDRGLLLRTVSCYSAEDTNYCGKCASCFRKWAALWAVGIELDFHNPDIMMDYHNRCLADRYDPERNRTTLEAIAAYAIRGCSRH